MPTIPIKPEPIELLRARFPKCLERIWIAKVGMEDRPGLHREYIFDFEDGIRLLISREKYPWGEISIHVSASWENVKFDSLAETTKEIQKKYLELGGKGRLRLLGLSKQTQIKGIWTGIPHWIVDNNIQ